MGNWKSAHIAGSCAARDVPALRSALDPGRDYENFHCLVSGGMAGLDNWAHTSISASGNLAERGYDERDVAEQLEKLAEIAPSLAVKVHLGGECEDKKCVATVTLEDGESQVGPAEIDELPEKSHEAMLGNVFMQLKRRRGE